MPSKLSPVDSSKPSVDELTRHHGLELLRFAYQNGTYVWQDVSGAIKAQVSSAGQPVMIIPARRNASLEDAVGNYVWVSDRSTTRMVDLTTGVGARDLLTDRLPLVSATKAGLFLTGGGYMVLDSTKLPALHC